MEHRPIAQAKDVNPPVLTQMQRNYLNAIIRNRVYAEFDQGIRHTPQSRAALILKIEQEYIDSISFLN